MIIIKMTTILTFTFSMSTKEYTLPDLFIKLTMFYFRRRAFLAYGLKYF